MDKIDKIRNPNIEIRNKSETEKNSNYQNDKNVSDIRISSLEFVSNFGFRASNL